MSGDAGVRGTAPLAPRSLSPAGGTAALWRIDVPIPASRRARQVEIEFTGTGRKGTVKMVPLRQWEVFIVPHKHLNAGFMDPQERVWELVAKNLNDAIDICDRTADWPNGSQFYWT